MINLTLTYVDRKERTSKAGKPFTSISIKAKEYADKYLSGFGNAQNKDWKVGDTVQVEAVTSKESNGKTYLNFEMPKKANGTSGGMTLSQAEELLIRVAKIQYIVERIMDYVRPDDGKTSAGTKVPDFSEVDDIGEFNEADIPPNF